MNKPVSVIVTSASIALFFQACEQPVKDATLKEPAGYVGAPACAPCHEQQLELWRGSDHDLAMQEADETTVLGDFHDAAFNHFGVETKFYKSDGKFYVRTDGADGQIQDYEVAYAFGVDPLQQYLIGFPDGRYQALSVAWDARPAEEGGQRWFYLHSDEKIPAGDEPHWTSPNYNWNFMCAECHSTNLQKNYDLEQDRYQTEWSELNVSCEACHGPGSNHVAWAEKVERGEGSREGSNGLLVRLKDEDNATWITDMETGLAKRSVPRQSRVEVETCARCHSRRSVVNDEYVYGRPLMDTHRPALLEDALYHADGQILDEVYVYGSFLQSKMYREGVTCQDCHDPHRLTVRGAGNSMCSSCHLVEKFDTPGHHFHRPESTGARCVECHMPAQNYMVVDSRRDHSLRIPRPDLTMKIGTPNACNRCHTDRPAEWAADAVAGWYGSDRAEEWHYGEALHAGRQGAPRAEAALVRVADDPAMPAIARATALSLLAVQAGQQSLPTIGRGLESRYPLIRAAALGTLEAVEPQSRLLMGGPLLGDAVRYVRLEAARVLASVPSDLMTPVQTARLDVVLEEYRSAQLVNADRAGYHLNLAVIDQQRGDIDSAERALLTAMGLDPLYTPAYVNLADVYRLSNREREGEKVLREGLVVAPNDGALHHSLGLALARQQRTAEAVEALARAADLRPEEPRYSYVYAAALHSVGETDLAIAVFQGAHERHPGNRDLLMALATMNRDTGQLSTAVEYARKLVALSPQDPNALQFLTQLEAQQ